MLSKRSRLTFANVVALIALFVALGGVGAAEPVADTAASLGSSVKKAVGLSKKANRNSSNALRLARQANQKASSVRAQRGQPGAQGPAGAPGSKGDKGDTGQPGSAVVARARGTTSQAATNTVANYPLSNGTWAPQADQSDILFGEVAFTPPGNCGPVPRLLNLTVLVDGQIVATSAANSFDSSPQKITVGSVLETGTTTDRTVTAEISDTCTTDHFIVNSVKVNVVAFR